jgi:hypothetical protein
MSVVNIMVSTGGKSVVCGPLLLLLGLQEVFLVVMPILGRSDLGENVYVYTILRISLSYFVLFYGSSVRRVYACACR